MKKRMFTVSLRLRSGASGSCRRLQPAARRQQISRSGQPRARFHSQLAGRHARDTVFASRTMGGALISTPRISPPAAPLKPTIFSVILRNMKSARPLFLA